MGVFFGVRACSAPKADPAQQQDAGAQGTPQEGGTQATQANVPAGATDINLLMVGDMLFHYQVRMSGLADDGSRNYDHLFTHVLSELEGKDIKVINQETPIAGPIFTGSAPDGYDGYPEFNGPQEVGDAEVKAGFNTILKATNHAMDHSGSFDDHYTLVKAEREFWKSKHPEVAVIGQADPTDANSSVDDVYVYDKNGFKVALLNYTLDLNGNEVNDTDGIVSMLEEEHIKTTMAKAREMADMVVVFPHWGEEYSLEPVEEQKAWAQLFVDEGADVIIGNHPHVMEPVTVLEGEGGKKVPCYWSTGNFVSTSPSDESLMGGMAEVTLRKAADGTCSVVSATFVPMVTHLGLSTDMTTYFLRDWTNDLAATNELHTDINDADNTTLTVEWANNFCEQLFGSAFDAEKSLATLDLNAASSNATTETNADATTETSTE
ncbi:MAG: CapA family protein, partial [Coriobacteriales bacterium]|nr:CapA family protein [Coriobacteriales bacterium]